MACCTATFIFGHKLFKDTAEMHRSCRRLDFCLPLSEREVIAAEHLDNH